MLEEEKEKQPTAKVYSKEDFSVVNRFESKCSQNVINLQSNRTCLICIPSIIDHFCPSASVHLGSVRLWGFESQLNPSNGVLPNSLFT